MGRVQTQGTDSVVHQKAHIKLEQVDNAFLHSALFSEDDILQTAFKVFSSVEILCLLALMVMMMV